MSQQALPCLRADAGDVEELGAAVAHGAALAVVADGEAVALVADHLDEMEDGRAAVEDDGIVFRAVEVDDLFFFGDGGERLRSDAEGFESLGGGVELAEAAVDEDQRGHGFGFFGGGCRGLPGPQMRGTVGHPIWGRADGALWG